MSPSPPPPRWRLGWPGLGWPDLLLAALLLAALARLVAAGTSTLGTIPAWFNEELQPLVRLLAEGQPIVSVDRRQYGVFAFLVMDLPVRLVRDRLDIDPDIGIVGAGGYPLSVYALALSLAAAGGALALFARRFVAPRPRPLLVAGSLWLSFTPLTYVIAQRSVDAWQLLFLTAALFLWTGSARQRLFAGLPLAAAALTKLLPSFLLLFLLVRSPRAALSGIAAALALLSVGQVLYGPLLGFGYPFAILGAGGATVAAWSTHFENNSVRGLIYKLGAGYRLQPNDIVYALDPGVAPLLNLLAYAAQAALAAYALFVAWRSREHTGGAHIGAEHTALAFGLAIVTMLLISPHTAHDYTVAMLPVYGVGAVVLLRRRRPGRGLIAALGITSALLVGVFAPLAWVVRVLPLDWLLAASGNASNTFIPRWVGGGIGLYQFFGFPGYGLLLGWLAAALLERQVWRLRAVDQPSEGASAAASAPAAERAVPEARPERARTAARSAT